MFLIADELEELTGYVVPAYQAKWLNRNGYPFDMSAAGRPKVLRAYVDQRLGGIASSTTKAETKPDFSHWR